MATNRYEQRKNFEEGEANAIGTKSCTDLLPLADAAKVRMLLGLYLDQRIQFLHQCDDTRRSINQRTSHCRLISGQWSADRRPTSRRRLRRWFSPA